MMSPKSYQVTGLSLFLPCFATLINFPELGQDGEVKEKSFSCWPKVLIQVGVKAQEAVPVLWSFHTLHVSRKKMSVCH